MDQQQPNKKSPSLLYSGAVVSSFTMYSRVLGLARDVVIARIFGSEDAADAFFVAFKIPNFFRRLFAEGAFSQAFVPVLSDYRLHRKHDEIVQFLSRVAGALGGVLLLFVLLAVFASKWVASVFAWGFIDEPDKFALTSAMISVTFPYLLLISLAGFAGAILNAYDRFAIPAATPILLNISLIVAALFATPWFQEPVFALAWGVFIAGILQLLFQLPFLARMHLLPMPTWDWSDSGVRRVLKLMGPAMFGVSVSQINLLLDTLIATFLVSGSVSWLYYSDRLMELPLGVFGIAVATIILPRLSRQYSAKQTEDFSATLDWAIKMILLIAVPAAIALIIIAKPILSTLFLYGVMSSVDIDMASYSLAAYGLGLLAFMLIKILAPGFYSQQDTRTPVKIGIIAMLSNMVLNVAFVLPLYHWYNIGHVGLALATSASAWINALLLLYILKKRSIYVPCPGWLKFFSQLFIANSLLIALLIAGNYYWDHWYDWSFLERSWRLLLVCSGGLLIYTIGLFMTGIRVRQFK